MKLASVSVQLLSSVEKEKPGAWRVAVLVVLVVAAATATYYYHSMLC